MKAARMISVFGIAVMLASLFGPGAAPVFAAGAGPAFVVNGTGDAGDASVGNGICATTLGKCTLRAAIQEANANSDTNAIQFQLPGTLGHVISIVTSPLPEITSPVVLDATTQPGCTVPCVALSGGPGNGLVLHTDNSVVKGLIIAGFDNVGIGIIGSNNLVQKNYIGIWPGGPASTSNEHGIVINGSNNRIGGTTPGQRNVISGNRVYGILVGANQAILSTGNKIRGNFIGTDSSGMSEYGNLSVGIVIGLPAQHTQVGGTLSGEGNVISANGWNGISAVGPYTVIQGNLIGTRADGGGSLGNAYAGIIVEVQAAGMIISGNRIAHNDVKGIIIIGGGTGAARIQRNRIFSNGGLGIDLNNDGVTSNDGLDPDSGPNGLQNFPVVASADSVTEAIVARLYSKANSTYTLEFFSSPAGKCDPSNHGEGRKYLGSKTVTTDAAGYVRVRFVSPIPFAAGEVITATATDSGGRTSEFSKCKVAQ